jgi:Phage integrase, N-terminal SAM-like domain
VFEYTLANGTVRFGIKFVVPQEDGSTKPVLRRHDPNGKPWTTRTAANAAFWDALSKVERGEFVEPSKQTLGEFLDEWVEGLRLAPSTVASYRKNIRLYIKPYLGGAPLTGP